MTEIDEKVAPPATPKKLRIVKVAKEFHVSVETLMEFLQEEGFTVQNQMSLVTPEMLMSWIFRPRLSSAAKRNKNG
jgi:hypothetical protein